MPLTEKNKLMMLKIVIINITKSGNQVRGSLFSAKYDLSSLFYNIKYVIKLYKTYQYLKKECLSLEVFMLLNYYIMKVDV